MIFQALHAAIGNFAFGLVIGCTIALVAVTISERHNKRAQHEAIREIEQRGRRGGRRL